MTRSVLALVVAMTSVSVFAGSKFDPAERLRIIDPVDEGVLDLKATYCSASVRFGAKSEIADLALEYRRKDSDAAWTRGETPVWFGDVANYRGSIFYLDEAADYEVRLSAGNKTLASGSFRTWTSEVPIAKTVVINPATAKYPIVVKESGTAEGWIRYTAKRGTVLGRPDLMDSVFRLEGVHHVLLDDMTVEGGGPADKNTPVFMTNSRAIRIRNCEFYGYGRKSFASLEGNAAGKPVAGFRNGKPLVVNWDAAVMIWFGCSEVTVERCYFHDPRGNSNSWFYSHPAGYEGVFFARTDGSIVLRWNDVVGSDNHRWNDALEGWQNFSADGGLRRDSDVYGNFCIFANDDCVELDGGMQNIRCFHNRCEAALTAVSIQGCMVSPTYVIDNLLGPKGEAFGIESDRIKTSGFNMWKLPSYAGIWGNWMSEPKFVTDRSEGSRIDFRDSNIVTTNAVPAEVMAKYPVRDLPFLLDRGIIDGVTVRGDSAAPASVVLTATATRAQPYRIRKNFDSDWFSVTPSEGTLRPGENRFTLTFDPAKMHDRRFWRAAFLVRTPEGLSRCCSVYAERTDFVPPAKPVAADARTVYAAPFNAVKLARKDPLEFSFDLAEDGDYWLMARVQGAAGAVHSRIEVSLDGAAWDSSFIRTWDTHPAWVYYSPGKRSRFSGAETHSRPRKLKAGHHVIRLRRYGNDEVTVFDLAVTDRPFAFEPR